MNTSNFSKADLKQMAINLKTTIANQKAYLHKIEVAHNKKVRAEKHELANFKKRLVEIQTLIKTK